MVSIALILLLIGIGVWYWLFSREKKRAEEGKSRLPGWRLALAVVAGMIALFSGGCSLLFLGDAANGNQYIDYTAILIIGGIPFAIAALILWLALRRGGTSA